MTFIDYYLYFFIFLVVVYSGALIWETFFSKNKEPENPQPPFYCPGTQYEEVDDFCDPFSPYYRSLCSTELPDSGREPHQSEDFQKWPEESSISQPEFFSQELHQNNFPRDYYAHHDHHHCHHHDDDYDDYWDTYDSFDPCDPTDPFYDDFCSSSDDGR